MEKSEYKSPVRQLGLYIAALLLFVFLGFRMDANAADLHNIPNIKLEGVNSVEEPFPYGFFGYPQ